MKSCDNTIDCYPNKLTLQKIISVVTQSFETVTVHSHPAQTLNLLTTDLTVLNLGSRVLLALFQSRRTASVTHWLREHHAHTGKRNSKQPREKHPDRGSSRARPAATRVTATLALPPSSQSC